MRSGHTAINAELVLYGYDIDVVDIEKIRRSTVGIEFVLIELEPYPLRVIVPLGTIIDCTDHTVDLRKFGSDSLANVCGESRDATAPRHVVAQKSYGSRVWCVHEPAILSTRPALFGRLCAIAANRGMAAGLRERCSRLPPSDPALNVRSLTILM